MMEEKVERALKASKKDTKMVYTGLQHLRQNLSNRTLEEFVVATLEMLMLVERDEYLQQLKGEGEHDKGNGSYPRSFRSLSRNNLIINVPRTRSGEFSPSTIELIKQSQEQINALVLLLYQKGLTQRDVSDIMRNFFGEEVSSYTVGNIAEAFNEARMAWENSQLESYYKVVYCDAMYMSLRRGDSYSKEAVHLIYGLRGDNKRELLSIEVSPTENAENWGEHFAKIRRRGVEKVDLVVADGLAGLEDMVHRYFPGAHFQRCVVHKMRNVLNKIRPKDKHEASRDLTHVFNNFSSDSTVEEAGNKLAEFIAKWKKKYPYIDRHFRDAEYLFSYIKYPAKVRRMIYTTNSLESLNKKIRKATKNKQSFEKEERLLDYIFYVIKEFESNNWMRYPVNHFKDWTPNRHNC